MGKCHLLEVPLAGLSRLVGVRDISQRWNYLSLLVGTSWVDFLLSNTLRGHTVFICVILSSRRGKFNFSTLFAVSILFNRFLAFTSQRPSVWRGRLVMKEFYKSSISLTLLALPRTLLVALPICWRFFSMLWICFISELCEIKYINCCQVSLSFPSTKSFFQNFWISSFVMDGIVRYMSWGLWFDPSLL